MIRELTFGTMVVEPGELYDTYQFVYGCESVQTTIPIKYNKVLDRLEVDLFEI